MFRFRIPLFHAAQGIPQVINQYWSIFTSIPISTTLDFDSAKKDK